MKIQKRRLEESIKKALIKEDGNGPAVNGNADGNEPEGNSAGAPEIVKKGPRVNDMEWIKKELYATELFRKRYLTGSINKSLTTLGRLYEPIKELNDAYGKGEDQNREHFVTLMTKYGVCGPLVRNIIKEKFRTELPNVFWEFSFYETTPQGKRHFKDKDGVKSLVASLSSLGEVDDIAKIRENMVDLLKHLNLNRERLQEYKERTYESYEQLMGAVNEEIYAEERIINDIAHNPVDTTEDLKKKFEEVSVLIANILNHFYEMLTRRIYVLNSLLQEKYKRYR